MNRVLQPRPLVVLGLNVWMGTAAGADASRAAHFVPSKSWRFVPYERWPSQVHASNANSQHRDPGPRGCHCPQRRSLSLQLVTFSSNRSTVASTRRNPGTCARSPRPCCAGRFSSRHSKPVGASEDQPRPGMRCRADGATGSVSWQVGVFPGLRPKPKPQTQTPNPKPRTAVPPQCF
jgi:hypothetical protein